MNILNEAISVVEERAKTHGDFRVVHETIAELWTTYAGMGKFESYDVAMMMALVKVGRIIASDQRNDDNYVDMVGYAYLARELKRGASDGPMEYDQEEYADREPYQQVSVGGD